MNYTEIAVSVLVTLFSVCTVLRRLENKGKLFMPVWLSAVVNVLAANPVPFVPRKNKPRMFPKLVVLAPLLLLVSCASPITIAAQTTASVAKLSQAAAETFDRIDATKVEEIHAQYHIDHDEARAEKALAAWDKTATQVNQAMLILNGAVQSAREAVRLAHAGKKINIGAEVATLLKAFLALKDAFKAFGVNLPTGGLL